MTGVNAMLNFDLRVKWDAENHGEPFYTAHIDLPAAFEAYATVTVGFTEEMGGWSLAIWDLRPGQYNSPPLFESHKPQPNVPMTRGEALRMQAESIAALAAWVIEASSLLDASPVA